MEQDTAVPFYRSLSSPDDAPTDYLTIGARQLLEHMFKSEVAVHSVQQARLIGNGNRGQIAHHLHLQEGEVLTGVGTKSVSKLRDRENEWLSGLIQISSLIPPNYFHSVESAAELQPLKNLVNIRGSNFLEVLATLSGLSELGLIATASSCLKAGRGGEFFVWLNRYLSKQCNGHIGAAGLGFLPCLNQERLRQLVIICTNAQGTEDFNSTVDGHRESKQRWQELLLALDRYGLESGPDLAISNFSKWFEWRAARHLVSPANSVTGHARLAMFSLHARKANLKQQLRSHLSELGFKKFSQGLFQVSGNNKDVIRNLHRSQRDDLLERKVDFIRRSVPTLLKHFASGHEVNPERICPILERIPSGSRLGEIFQFASLTWSVPVSSGFGRRIRYLVWDKHNEKLIGLIAIGDPVLNSAVRDRRIGWNIKDRAARLVNIMDAYVLGAVPPYNALLGGKMIACLLRSRKLFDDFKEIYGQKEGIISRQKKNPRLLVVTTSSSMGRSSVYNRLKLNGVQYLESVGNTAGWGHFHIPDQLFADLRDYLRCIGHAYADENEYGDGPSWRLRTTRAALKALGFEDDMLRHGVKREFFMCFLADNAVDILRGGIDEPDTESLLTVNEIAEAAVDRWVVPRALRRPDYKSWTPDNLIELFGQQSQFLRSQVSRIAK